ncbi:hypothetical protein [Microbacterium sp. JZ31]|uniref:hypothetical protein n=1 Tax=Microbacterium sp. JZ31 TaxID=1906274 RepID=UPI001933166D|nr:hypothetical protein [Microbacterium sp. JZ31]
MRTVRPLLVSSLIVVLLSGCASPLVAGPGEVPPSSAAASSSPSRAATETAQPEAPTKADLWLEQLVLPPGAVPVEATPEGASFDPGRYAPPCRPVHRQSGLWFVPGAEFTETWNWMIEHPSADLVVPTAFTPNDDPQIDSRMLSNVPEQTSLEGVVYKVAGADGGVAISAEIYAFSDQTVCDTPPPGTSWGGPGMG